MDEPSERLISRRERKRIGVIERDGKMHEICLSGSQCCGYDVAILIPESLREAERDWKMDQINDCIHRYVQHTSPVDTTQRSF